MNKYVNGKILAMTATDKEKIRKAHNGHVGSRAKTSEYEDRIQELENTVEKLLSQINKTENE